MNPLLERVLATPREAGGTLATNRYRFQHHCGVDLLIDLFLSSDDFMLVCEHHEDLLVLNHETNPTRYSLYQVKTLGRGNWTAKKLCEREREDSREPSSILGQMTRSLLIIGCQGLDSAVLLSNQPFNVCIRPNADRRVHDTLLLGDVSGKCHKTVTKMLTKDLGRALLPAESARIQLRRTRFDVTNHEEFVCGRLARVLHDIPNTPSINPIPLVRVLQAEIARRSAVEATPRNDEELRNLKSITRSDFKRWLGDAVACSIRPRTVHEWWPLAVADLVAEQFKFLERRLLYRRALEHEVAIVTNPTAELLDLEERVQNVVEASTSASLRGLLADVLAAAPTMSGHDAAYIHSVALREVYGNASEPVQVSGPGTETEDS